MRVRPALAWRALMPVSVAFAVVLIVSSAGYGYHRDELYFLAIGGHPALGYVDQPPLVPVLAHVMDAVSGHSLIWLRVPPAVAGALIVFVTGVIAREFGAGRGAQVLAAATMAVSAILVSASHLSTTTIFDLLIWSVL
ncbi:MAG: glycosyltransferase family 39 protein, partial [Ornithinibacter sp.]